MSVPALRLLVGSYTARSGGHGTGISLVEPTTEAGTEPQFESQDVRLTGSAPETASALPTERAAQPAGSVAAPDAGGALTARTIAVLDDPSFLAVRDGHVYAVSETEDGGVHAFRFDGHGLERAWDAPSGGDAPCHIRVDVSGTLVVTNYTSGTVTAVALAAQGTGPQHAVAPTIATELLPDVEGPVIDRQEGPHAHQSISGPDGDTVLVADLGGDALHEYRITVDEDGVPGIERVRVHRVTPGVGPRHMAWLDGDLLVAGELDGRVHRLRPDGSGSLREVASAATTDGSEGELFLSHLDVDDAGRVYVAVRGQDTVVVLDGRDGGLSFVAAVPCGGVWPRHFLLADGHVFVANQFSDTVTVLPLDAEGVPGGVVAEITVGSPACLVRID